jgi:hypothetical protein
MRLSGKTIKYSPQEIKVFGVLKKKPQSTLDLKRQLYTPKTEPFFGRQTVIAAIRSLSKKIEANKEPFVIRQTRHAGPHPMSFWIEPK